LIFEEASVLLSLRIFAACADFRISHRRDTEDTELRKFELRNSNCEIFLGVLCASVVNPRVSEFRLRLCPLGPLLPLRRSEEGEVTSAERRDVNRELAASRERVQHRHGSQITRLPITLA